MYIVLAVVIPYCHDCFWVMWKVQEDVQLGTYLSRNLKLSQPIYFFFTVSDHSSGSPSDLDKDNDSHSPTRCVIFICKLEHGLKLTLLQKLLVMLTVLWSSCSAGRYYCENTSLKRKKSTTFSYLDIYTELWNWWYWDLMIKLLGPKFCSTFRILYKWSKIFKVSEVFICEPEILQLCSSCDQ